MNARYALWARVELLNQYFLDDKGHGIAFIPTMETKAALADARMLVKRVDNSLLIITETDGSDRPKIPLAAETRLTFYLELVEPWVTTVSNIDLDALRKQRFYFSNRASNLVGVVPNQRRHLSVPLPAYDATQEYLPGTLVSHSGHAHECLQASTGNAPGAPNSTFWVDKGQAAFVSGDDLLAVRPRVSHFRLTTAASVFQIHVYGFNTNTDAYDALVYESVVEQADGASVDTVLVNLAHLRPARYRLTINAEEFDAFFDDEAKARSAFGIIELFHHHQPTDAYSAVNSDGTLREVEYTIVFANRRAYWKYFTPQHQVSDIKLAGAPNDPSPFTASPANDFYISNVPLGLSEAPGANVFDLIVAGDARPAPRPDPRMPGVLTHTYDEVRQIWREPVFNIRLNL